MFDDQTENTSILVQLGGQQECRKFVFNGDLSTRAHERKILNARDANTRPEWKKKISPVDGPSRSFGDLDGPDSLFRVSSESARALKKYTTDSFQVVGLHNAIA